MTNNNDGAPPAPDRFFDPVERDYIAAREAFVELSKSMNALGAFVLSRSKLDPFGLRIIATALDAATLQEKLLRMAVNVHGD